MNTMQLLRVNRKYKGQYLSLYNIAYELKDQIYEQETISRKGTQHIPDMLSLSNIGTTTDGVSCIIMNKAHDAICLIQEYRPAADVWVCDIPMGLIEEDETPEEAAIRETKEETGLNDVTVLKTLPSSYVNPSFSDSKVSTIILEASGETSINEDKIVPLWLPLTKIRPLLTHPNCPPMSSKTQIVLYLLAMSQNLDFLINT